MSMVEPGDDLVGAIVSLVQEGSRAETARRGLQFLAKMLRCSCAAAWAEQDGELQMLSGYGVDQAAMDTIHSTWNTARRHLSTGERIHGTQSAVVPLMVGDELVGVAYLRSEGLLPPLPYQLAPLWAILGKLCRTPAQAAPGGALQGMADGLPTEVEREQLLACLERNEWNLARVARVNGVTRPTIYAWMGRLGIERKRVHLASGFAIRKRA